MPWPREGSLPFARGCGFRGLGCTYVLSSRLVRTVRYVGGVRRESLDVRVEWRVSSAERELLRGAAAARGWTVSDLLRDRLADVLGSGPREVSEPRARKARSKVAKRSRKAEAPEGRPLPSPAQLAVRTGNVYPPARAAQVLKDGKVRWEGDELVVDGRRW